MNLAKILSGIFALALVLADEEAFSAKSIPFDARFVSPDGGQTVDFVMIDREWHFRISDSRTGHVEDSIVMPSLVLYLRWASNSRAFVTVEHIAGGSYGRIVYLKDGKWTNVEVVPPDDSMKSFSVISLTLQESHVHFKLSVDYEKGNGIPTHFMFYDVDFELDTGKILDAKWTAISHSEWLASLKREPSYVPAMDKR
jgi:hypothetical protein